MVNLQEFYQDTITARTPPMGCKVNLRIADHGGISLDYGVKRVIRQRESRIVKVSNNHHVSRTTKYRVPKPSIWDLGLWLVKIDHLVLGRFLVG
jgi:hypothetical protein